MCCWLAPVISALHVVSLLDHSNANIVGLQKVTILRRFCGFTLYSHTTQRYALSFFMTMAKMKNILMNRRQKESDDYLVGDMYRNEQKERTTTY